MDFVAVLLPDLQDGAAAGGGRGGLHHRWAHGSFGQPWKINMESRSLARLAGDADPALMLLDNAEHGGQAEAGAFAHVLGVEERFENSRLYFRRNAAAGVADAQPDEGAGAGGGGF